MIVYFISIVTIGLYVWLNYLAFRKWKRSKAIRRFTILLLLVTVWMIIVTLETAVGEVKFGSLWFSNLLAKLDFILAAVIAYFVSLFTFHFPRNNEKLTFRKELLLLAPIATVSALVFANFIFSEFKIFNKPEEYYLGYWLYIIVVSIYFVLLTLGSALYKLRHAKGIERLQLKYFCLSFGLSIFTLLMMSVLNAVFDIDDRIDLLLSDASLVFIIGTVYAVLKHRLFGLRYFVRKGAISAIAFFLLFFLYTYFIFWLTGRYGQHLGSSTTQTITTVLVIVLSYPVLRRWIRKLINTLFSPSETARRERLMARISQTAGSMSYTSLFPKLEQEVKRRIPVIGIQCVVLEVSGDYFEQYPEKHFEKPLFTRSHPMVRLLKEGERIIVRDEIPFLLVERPEDKQREYQEAKALLEQLRVSVAVLFGSSEVGPVILLLPEKRDRNAYGTEELLFLKELSNEASGAFENVFLYQQALKRAGIPIS